LINAEKGYNDIVYNIMTKKKLAALRRRVSELRRKKGVSSNEVVSIAEALGRRRFGRGKEPTWIMTDRRPLSIPNRKDLAPGTKNNILDTLEADINDYEERLIGEIGKNNGHF
jgi:hypothetical protein